MADPLIIVIRVLADERVWNILGQIRECLDHEEIDPRQFKTEVDSKGYRLTLGFHNLDEARRFQAGFEAGGQLLAA